MKADRIPITKAGVRKYNFFAEELRRLTALGIPDIWQFNDMAVSMFRLYDRNCGTNHAGEYIPIGVRRCK